MTVDSTVRAAYVVANVILGEEKPVESDALGRAAMHPPCMCACSDPWRSAATACALALPASRKVRALLAYLALAPHAVTRSQLCELLWDVPNDPRGELRWCLSKIRSILDEPGRRQGSDPRRHHRARPGGLLRRCDRGRPRDAEGHRDACLRSGCGALCALFAGDFLEAWRSTAARSSTAGSSAQRRRFRGCHAALLEHLAESVSGDEVFGYLEKWLRARAVRPARPRDPADRAWPERPHSRGRGASGGDGPAVRGGRARQRADSRCVAGRQGAGQLPPPAPQPAPPPRRPPRPAAARDRRRRAPPRLHRGDAVCRSGRSQGPPTAGPPTASPTT